MVPFQTGLKAHNYPCTTDLQPSKEMKYYAKMFYIQLFILCTDCDVINDIYDDQIVASKYLYGNFL